MQKMQETNTTNDVEKLVWVTTQVGEQVALRLAEIAKRNDRSRSAECRKAFAAHIERHTTEEKAA